jgi:uncharacterized protein (TIGR02646 family)
VKPIRALEAPPPGLGDFVRETPHERDWRVFKDHQGGQPYRELLDALIERQHGLCCYCEVDLMALDWQVEHFHPKRDHGDGVNHTTDHGNLMAACCGGGRGDIWGAGNPRESVRDPLRHRDPTKANLSCGQAKDHHEEHLTGTAVIDPRVLPPLALILRVTLDGTMEPDEAACRTSGIDPLQVKETIRVLGLNCDRLRVAREAMLNDLSISYDDMDIDVLVAAARLTLLPDTSGRIPRFFTTARTFFREAAELVLSEHPQAWI